MTAINASMRARRQVQRAQVGFVDPVTIGLATTAILAAFGCDWSDVGDWITSIGREARDARGLTKAGAQAQAYFEAYNPADHEAQFTDEATVRALCAAVQQPGQIGPALADKIWKYWVNVMKPRREQEARELGSRQAAEEQAQRIALEEQARKLAAKREQNRLEKLAGGSYRTQQLLMTSLTSSPEPTRSIVAPVMRSVDPPMATTTKLAIGGGTAAAAAALWFVLR